jgi:hypothetical protein
VLRFINTTDEIMGAQAQYLHERGMNRIGLLQAEHPYLEEVAQALQRTLRPGQSLEVIDRIPNTDLELRSQVIKLHKRREDFDAIGTFLALGQTLLIRKRSATCSQKDRPPLASLWITRLCGV